jgi:hypothetical protein
MKKPSSLQSPARGQKVARGKRGAAPGERHKKISLPLPTRTARGERAEVRGVSPETRTKFSFRRP